MTGDKAVELINEWLIMTIGMNVKKKEGVKMSSFFYRQWS